eukprot:5433391-Pleurochrysis_carterae.AAC.5
MQNDFARYAKVVSGVAADRASHEQPLEGRTRLQLVVGSTQLSHARLSWRVLEILFFTDRHQSFYRPGRAGATNYIKYTIFRALGASAGAGAGARLRVGSKRGRSVIGSGHRE